MVGCGTLTKGKNPKDDLVPCGTRLWFIVDKRTVKESMLLCANCKALDMQGDADVQ
jgi:hypothetical protein